MEFSVELDDPGFLYEDRKVGQKIGLPEAMSSKRDAPGSPMNLLSFLVVSFVSSFEDEIDIGDLF